MVRLQNQLLTQVVEQCFDLSMSGAVPAEARREYLALGKRLRGALLNVLSAQFDERAPEFIAANTALREANSELDRARQNLEDAVKAVQRVGELAARLDDVLKVAEKFV